MGRSFAFPHGLDSLLGSMGFPRRGARLWMGGVMPDTRSIPMAETRGAHWQAHARPQSARQAWQSSHAKQSGRTQFNAPSTVERALDAEPNRAAKPVRAADSVRAEQAHRGKQSSRSTQSPAGATRPSRLANTRTAADAQRFFRFAASPRT